MSEQLTPWFPGDVKPVRPGVYHVRTKMHNGGDRPYSFSHFDGEHWNGSWNHQGTAEDCFQFYATSGSQGSCELLIKWRGLASNPSKAAA